MDGTLLDTRLDIARAANNARVELGLPEMTVEQVVAAVGDGVNLFVSRVTFPESDPRFADARKVFLRHYAENIHGETKPYDGIIEVLEALSAQGYPMGIVSNKPAALVDELVRFFEWQKYFKVWLGGDSAARSKPAADPVRMALTNMSLKPDHPVVMIGDGDQDILAAKAVAGMAVWCAWGFNPNPTREHPFIEARVPRDILKVLS
jgi:phosphoglycolate phosphatase